MTEIKNTAVQGEDSTPMWSSISAEDDKAVMAKFQAESSKVVESWSMGNASVVEKDAAVSFLIQLGVVQITFQSDDHQCSVLLFYSAPFCYYFGSIFPFLDDQYVEAYLNHLCGLF
nr:uncharacterized protein LOC129271986 [Lytechinus pictus]